MHKLTVGSIVLVTALLLTAGLVAAHDTSTEDEVPDTNGTEQVDRMKEQMTEHMGEDRSERMYERMGTSDEEMGAMMGDEHASGTMGGMGSGMGCH